MPDQVKNVQQAVERYCAEKGSSVPTDSRYVAYPVEEGFLVAIQRQTSGGQYEVYQLLGLVTKSGYVNQSPLIKNAASAIGSFRLFSGQTGAETGETLTATYNYESARWYVTAGNKPIAYVTKEGMIQVVKRTA
jgi:hypothetical protein